MANILIVDDEPSARLLMTYVLEMDGHKLTAAANGQEALRALGVKPPDPSALLPDLVILDVMMPVMDGYTAYLAIRNEPRTAALPVIVVTVQGDMRHLFDSLPCVAAFFNKPFDPKELREMVAKVLSSK